MLKGFQRKYLRSEAHHLDPVVMIGKGGVSDAVIQKIEKSLDDHELIKIRFLEYERDEKKEMCEEIQKATHAMCAGRVGHVAIFYRQHPEKDRRRIRLPEGSESPSK